MGLLDNLFKPKPESVGEKSVESSATSEAGEPHSPAGAVSSPKASPFLAPKIYVPRSSVQIVPPKSTPPPTERKLAPVADSPASPKEIVLTFGDVFSRIPTHFLKAGAPDLRRELKFPAAGLAADIARGRASVPLSAIVAQCPDAFVPEAEHGDLQVRLPLQKLVEQIGLGGVNRTNLAPISFAPANPPPAEPKPAETPVISPAPAVETAQPAASTAAPPTEPVNAPPISQPAPVVTEKAAPLPSVTTASPAADPTSSDDEQIHLSLAVIMKRCPREIIVQPLPPISESIRITFPFAPIERQLSTGQVEVSSMRFIAALPIDLMKCFEAKAGVKVPLPLEEIFQNLPNQTPPGVAAGRAASSVSVPEAVAEMGDLEREKARLAEAILLEPMFAPVPDAAPPAVPEAATSKSETENVVISGNFTPEPAPVLAEIPAAKVELPVAPEPAPAPADPVEVAPAKIELVSPVAPANESLPPEPIEPDVDPADELAAQLEALAAEDAKIESELASEPVPEPLSPAAETVVEPSFPEPPVAASEPAPVALPVMPTAVRPFVPELRPPVILQPRKESEELRPAIESAPEPVAPVLDPEPVAKLNLASSPEKIESPIEASAVETVEVAPPTLPATSIHLSEPPPVEEPKVERPTEVAAALPVGEPEISAPTPVGRAEPPRIAAESSPTVQIRPPQFRPFVVNAPPIVLKPAEASVSFSPATETTPVVAPAPAAPASPEPELVVPEITVTQPVSIEHEPAIPVPEPAPTLSAPPTIFHGRPAEFAIADDAFALPRLSQQLANLPGIQGCVLISRDADSQSGQIPAGLDANAVRYLSQRMRGALSDRAGSLPSAEVQHLTLHAEAYSISLFTRGEACACAVHRARIFLPGVRERFASAAEELAGRS